MIEKLRSAGVNFESLREITDNRFAGMTFVLTGALSKFTREEATEQIELFGGKICDLAASVGIPCIQIQSNVADGKGGGSCSGFCSGSPQESANSRL